MLYLKWRLANLKQDVLHNPDLLLADIIRSQLQDKQMYKGQTIEEEDEEEEDLHDAANRLSQREIKLLLHFLENRKPFLSKISTIEKNRNQMIGVLTGNKPKSFATEVSRVLQIGGNRLDKGYLENLLKIMTSAAVSPSFVEDFKDVIDDIQKELETNPNLN